MEAGRRMPSPKHACMHECRHMYVCMHRWTDNSQTECLRLHILNGQKHKNAADNDWMYVYLISDVDVSSPGDQ